MSVTTAGSIGPFASSLAGVQGQRGCWSRRVAMDIVGALDVLAVVLGAVLPAWIYAMAGGIEINPVMIVKSALVTSMIMFICMQAWGMYDQSRMNDLPVYPGRLFGALLVSTLAALGLGVPFSVAEVHLWVWYAAWISASFTADRSACGSSRGACSNR